MSPAVLKLLRERREELDCIVATRDNWGQIKSWHAGVCPLLSKHFKDDLKPFNVHIDFKWTALPFMLSTRSQPGAWDGVRAKETVINDQRAKDAKLSMLRHLDTLIQLGEVDVPPIA